MKKRQWIVWFCLALCTGCDKDLTFDVDVEENKLVVFSIINPREPVSVSVSRSVNPYTSGVYKNDSYINNASVMVLENGSQFDQLVYDENTHVYTGDSSHIPTVGNEYLLVIQTQEFDEYISEAVVIPDSLEVDVAVINTGVNGSFGRISEIIFTFEDPSQFENAYGYDLTRDYDRSNGMGVTAFTWSIDKTYDEACNFYRTGIEGYSFEGSVFNDLCIDGQSVTLKITAQVRGSGPFVFRFYTLEPILFEYYKSFSRLGEAGVGYLEPLRVPSNVEGGYGLVASSNYIERIVVLGE